MQHLSQIASLFNYPLDDANKFDLRGFTAFINEKFISKDAATTDEEIVAKATGKRLGAFETKFIRAFNLTTDEVKDKKLEEIMDTAVAKYNGELDGLRQKLSTGTDERVLELSTQLEEKDKGFNEATRLLGETQLEFEKFKGESASKFKTYKISDKLNKVYARLNFIDGYEKDEVRKTGFNTLINKKYQFGLDDKDELVVNDNTGNRIKHPTKPGDFADAFTVLATEAEANNLLKKNNAKNPVVVNKSVQTDARKDVIGLPLHKKAAARIKA